MSVRLLEFKLEEGKDMYLVEYPGKGQRWVYSFMIGGQYKDEKAALKFRYEERNGISAPVSAPTATSSAADAIIDSDMIDASVAATNGPVIEARETLKCICQQQHAMSGEEIVTCSLCLKKSHLRCIRAEGQSALEVKEWQCPFCRILHMDPFNPGVELLMFASTPRNMLAASSQDGTLTMRFNVQPNVMKEWQNKKMSIVVRCVGLGPKSLNVPKGPMWPKDVTASVNSYKDVFKILPGKYGHVRREVPSKEISDLVKPNSNTVTVAYKTEAPAANSQLQPPRFLFGVVACEGKSKADILTMIKRPSVAEAKERDVILVQQAQLVFNSLQTKELVIETKADFDIVNTRCPLSLWEIDTPVRGIECEHLQCYDANSYVDVNIKIRNVEKRWRCPVCSKLARPEDLIVDEFLLEGMRGAKVALQVSVEEGLMKRLKLDTNRSEWDILEDEELQGEGSDDEYEEDYGGAAKRRRKEDTAAAEEIILD